MAARGDGVHGGAVIFKWGRGMFMEPFPRHVKYFLGLWGWLCCCILLSRCVCAGFFFFDRQRLFFAFLLFGGAVGLMIDCSLDRGV